MLISVEFAKGVRVERASSTDMGEEMPLAPEPRWIEKEPFNPGCTEVVDVPGVTLRGVVDLNCDLLLLGVVSVRVAFDSPRFTLNDVWLGAVVGIVLLSLDWVWVGIGVRKLIVRSGGASGREAEE